MAGTPAEAGFRFPPEWSPHARCFMAWPCEEETFVEMRKAREAYAVVAQAIARFEPVTVLANEEDVAEARELVGNAVAVEALGLDDSWARDIGPTFLTNDDGGLAGVDWRFNGWGKYEPFDRDAAVAGELLRRAGAEHFAAPIHLEGGAIHTDGCGTLLTTESVVLNDNRNPGLTRGDADEIFRAYLGVEQVVWLDDALEFDDTDGHVDNLACFARPGVVAMLAEVDPADPNHARLVENRRRLELSRDAAGRSFEIVDVQQPARQEVAGERLPLSYINHYIANGGVVVPVFDDPADGPALEQLARLYPQREVVPVPGIEIVKGGGCVHCITQQQPLV